MPRYRVELSRYVEQVATVEVEASDPGDALAKARHGIQNDHSEVNWTDGDGMLSVNYKSAKPNPRYCVDGLEYDDPDAPYIGDGKYAPFRVFDIDAQDYQPGEYGTREAAQTVADTLNA